MDRFTDVVELLVEHATDFRMCDLLDDNFAAGSNVKYNARKSGSDAVSLGLIPGETVVCPFGIFSPRNRRPILFVPFHIFHRHVREFY